jgi:plastocyanin
VHTAPITYSINGEQYVAVFAGGNSVPYSSPPGDNLWAFKLGGTVPQAATPTTPSVRQPITAAAVNGSAVGNTVLLGRTSATSAESTVSQNAMYPQNLVVPVGTTVTFVNPASSVNNHCAYSFFEHAFDTGVLIPGQAFSFAFNTPGEYSKKRAHLGDALRSARRGPRQSSAASLGFRRRRRGMETSAGPDCRSRTRVERYTLPG